MLSRRRRIRDATHELLTADSYDAWYAAAEAVDELTGMLAWRDDDDCGAYDARRIRSDIDAFAQCREMRDPQRLVRVLEDSLHRHHGDFELPELYEQAWSGTKRLITRYLEAVEEAVDWLMAVPDVPHQLRHASLVRFARGYGRSALLLSGGATLGFMHLGVVKALFEHDLLPNVMSGASMGAMVGAGICVRTDDELRGMLDDIGAIRRYALQLAPLRQMWSQRGVLDPSVMIETIRHNCGDLTFAEAYERTGRVLNISVSPTRRGQKPRLLCHTTAPDVLVSDAAMASSSIPGVYPAAQLFRRAATGARIPYVGSERWIDGSMHGDLPKRRMSRLHNVNHFIVSQTNPHVVPFLQDKRLRSRWGAAVGLSGRVLRYQSAGVLNAVELMSANTPLRPWATTVRSLVGQDYLGDIDIHPTFRPGLLLKAFTNPTEEDLRSYILAGERATWRHLARISVKTRLARCLSSAIRRSAEAAGLPVVGAGAYERL